MTIYSWHMQLHQRIIERASAPEIRKTPYIPKTCWA